MELVEVGDLEERDNAQLCKHSMIAEAGSGETDSCRDGCDEEEDCGPHVVRCDGSHMRLGGSEDTGRGRHPHEPPNDKRQNVYVLRARNID